MPKQKSWKYAELIAHLTKKRENNLLKPETTPSISRNWSTLAQGKQKK
jgi:hypothetical protein